MKKVIIAAAVVAFGLVSFANSVKDNTEKTVRTGLSHTEQQIEAASK